MFSCEYINSYLKVLSCHKGKWCLENSLLLSPLIPQLVVANKDLLPLLVEAWVDMHGNVITTQEINSKPGIQRSN